MREARDLLSLDELDSEEIVRILDLADVLKRERKRGIKRRILEGRSFAMLFESPSTRTRLSFATAVMESGGHVSSLEAGSLQLTRGETLEDTGKVMSQYVDAIAARVKSHVTVEKLADGAEVPVINLQSDKFHPCQTLADLLTLREAKGKLKGLKVAWVGDGTNVCNSLLIGCSKVGVDMVVATPRGNKPLGAAVKAALDLGRKTGSEIILTEDPVVAVEDADAVFADTLVSAGLEHKRKERLEVFLPRYQVNTKLMKKAKPDALFMHCLPAFRGEEVVAEVIDGPQSWVWEEAANRLHAQKALLCQMVLDRKRTSELL